MSTLVGVILSLAGIGLIFTTLYGLFIAAGVGGDFWWYCAGFVSLTLGGSLLKD